VLNFHDSESVTMKIVTVRRISQAFFFSMFVWFCVVSTVGEKFWQLRGWPVNRRNFLKTMGAAGLAPAFAGLTKGLEASAQLV